MRKTKNLSKKITAIILSSVLALTYSIPVMAVVDHSVIEATSGNITNTIETDVNTTSSTNTSVNVAASNGYTAAVTVNGNITNNNDNSYGANMATIDNSTAALNVVGDITVNPDATGNRSDTGVCLNANGTNAECSLQVTGDINAALKGISAYSVSYGKNIINVQGDISAYNDSNLNEASRAIDLCASNHGQNEAALNGNLYGTTAIITNATNGNNIVDVDGTVTGQSFGIYSLVNNGSNQIAVEGDVTSSFGDGVYAETNHIGTNDVIVEGNVSGDTGVSVSSHQGGDNKIIVSGDVIGESVGTLLITAGSGGSNTLIVEGVVAGGQCALRRINENNTVTVWKAELNNDGNIATDINGDVDRSFEQSIGYIIKMEQPAVGGTISVTNEDGSALAQVESIANTWNIANEGQKVLVKIDLQNGYEITGVYGNEGQEMPLIKDANGNYYVVMPKGGGIYLSATFEEVGIAPIRPVVVNRIEDVAQIATIARNENTTNVISNSSIDFEAQLDTQINIFLQQIIKLIASGRLDLLQSLIKVGFTINLANLTSLNEYTCNLLKQISDLGIPIRIDYNYLGINYRTTINAGGGENLLILSADGVCTIQELMSAFEIRTL